VPKCWTALLTLVLVLNASGARGQATPAAVAEPTVTRKDEPVTIMDRARGGLGIVVILAAVYLLSENRRAISRRVLFWGLVLQWGFALVVLRVDQGRIALNHAGEVVKQVLGCAVDGSAFVFGKALVDPAGPVGFVFAFREPAVRNRSTWPPRSSWARPRPPSRSGPTCPGSRAPSS
jgi:hypothetical protein